MTKLFKKSLALLLTLALCLSAMACCFLVSAEGESTPVGSISFVLADETMTEINPDAAVTIDVVANWTGVAGAEFTVTGIPADATVATTNTEVVINHDAAAATVKFVDGNNAELANGVLFSISFTAGKAGDSYTFAIADGSVFCNLAEEDVTVTCEPNSFEVVEKAPEECAHVKDAAAYVANETTGCYDSVVNCALCGEEMIRVETNIPSTTTVNTAITQDTYVNVYTSVGICTVITKAQLAAYDSYSIRYSRIGTDGDYNYSNANDEITSFLKYTSKKDYAIYSNIGLYQMNLPVSITICGYDAEKNLVAVSAPYVTTITDEMWLLYTADTATQINKTAYVDLVNMGTDAQLYFAKQGGADCDLAKVALPKDTYAFLQSDATQATPSYDLANMPNSITPTNTVTVGGKSCVLSNSVNLSAGAPAISYMIRRGASVTDPSLWSMSITYTDAYGAAQTKNIAGNEFSVSGTYAYFNYSPALYDTNKTITNIISYNGEVVYNSTYSVETYIAATLPTITNDEEFVNILSSIAKFGVSIRANFNVE